MSIVWKVRKDGVRQRFNLSPLRGEVKSLYGDGLSSRKVGEKLGISHARVLKLLKSEDVIRRGIVKSIPSLDYKKLNSYRSYIYGVMCGDGCIFSGVERKKQWSYRSYIVHLSVKDKDFLDEFVKNFKEVYGFSPNIYYRKRENEKWSNIWIARIKRKLVYEDLSTYNFSNFWVVPDEVLYSKDHNIISSFLKGVYDSEGSVCVGSRGASISFSNISKVGLLQVKLLLGKIGITSSKLGLYQGGKLLRKNPCYYFHITGLNNYLIFLNKVGFSIKRKEDKLKSHINGLKSMELTTI